MLQRDIKYNGCTYRCYLKEMKGKHGSYYRAFCGRKDKKCKVTPHLPAVVTKSVLPEVRKADAKISLAKEARLYQQMLEYRLETVIKQAHQPLTTRVKKRGREWLVTDLESPGKTLNIPAFPSKMKAIEYAERNTTAVVERLNAEIDTMEKIRAGKEIDFEDIGFQKYIQMVGDYQRKPKHVIDDAIRDIERGKAGLPDWAVLTPESKAPPEPKPIPKAKPQAGEKQIEKWRNLADRMEKQIQSKLNPPIGEQRTTARRARMAANIREQGEYLQKIQTVLYYMADALQAKRLPPILQGVSSKADVDKLLTRIRLRAENPIGKQGVTIERAWWMRLPQKPSPKDYPSRGSYEAELKEWKAYHQMGLDTDAKLLKAMDALELIASPKRTREQEQAMIVRQMEEALIGRKIPGYFPTPEKIVNQMIQEADLAPGMTVLEPSAGKGNIADAIRAKCPGCKLEVIEFQTELRQILAAKGYEVVAADFLKYNKKQYDRIIQNPPFEQLQDIDHVQHAYNLLKPGGRLVSIMSVGPFFRSDKKAVQFRQWLESVDGDYEELPEGAFYSSERPTGVKTVLVTVDNGRKSIGIGNSEFGFRN